MANFDPFAGLGYLGSYDPALDNQCRVAIPSEWRNKDGDTCFVLVPGSGRDLRLLPPDLLTDFVEKARKDPFNEELQDALAWFGANARKCVCDKQGRIKLDKAMLESAGIYAQIKLIGAVTHIRVCNPDNWQNTGPDGNADRVNALRKVSSPGGGVMQVLKDLK